VTQRPNRAPRWLSPALAIVPVVALGAFYAWPLATVLARSFAWDALGDTLGRARTWRVLWFTSWQAAASTALTVAAGWVPARVFARWEFRGRRALLAATTAVFVLPSVVVGAAVLALLPAPLNRSVPAILIAHVLLNLTVVIRTVGAMWATLPEDLEAAAATLGASPSQVRREITLPLLRPAVASASLVVFAFCFASFGVIRVVGGSRATVETEVWRQAIQNGNLAVAAVLAVLQIAMLGVTAAVAALVQRRGAVRLAVRTGAPRRRAVTGRQRWTVRATAAFVTLALLAPSAALVERSFRVGDRHSLAPWRELGRPTTRRGVTVELRPLDAVLTSLRFAVAASVLAVAIGVLGSLAIEAGRRAGRALDLGLMLPIVTSAVTVGLGLFITFDRPPIDWRASPWLVVVGQAMIGVPFVVRATLPVLRALDPGLRQAAATLGASPVRAWREVTVAHVRRPAAIGAGLAAAVSLGEFGATSVLSRRGSETLPVVIDRLLGRPGGLPHAQGYVLAVLLAALTVTVAMVLEGGRGARRP